MSEISPALPNCLRRFFFNFQIVERSRKLVDLEKLCFETTSSRAWAFEVVSLNSVELSLESESFVFCRLPVTRLAANVGVYAVRGIGGLGK